MVFEPNVSNWPLEGEWRMGLDGVYEVASEARFVMRAGADVVIVKLLASRVLELPNMVVSSSDADSARCC